MQSCLLNIQGTFKSSIKSGLNKILTLKGIILYSWTDMERQASKPCSGGSAPREFSTYRVQGSVQGPKKLGTFVFFVVLEDHQGQLYVVMFVKAGLTLDRSRTNHCVCCLCAKPWRDWRDRQRNFSIKNHVFVYNTSAPITFKTIHSIQTFIQQVSYFKYLQPSERSWDLCLLSEAEVIALLV